MKIYMLKPTKPHYIKRRGKGDGGKGTKGEEVVEVVMSTTSSRNKYGKDKV